MLYLDTARLGQTSPSALETQVDFFRLTAEQPSSLYTDRFLAEGIEAAPDSWIERFPGLGRWRGVAELKKKVLLAADAPSGHEVAIASRSTLLMRTAASAMYRLCRNVLVTDLNWPAYQTEVAHTAARTHQRYTVFSCRNRLSRHQMSSERLISEITKLYNKQCCDGVFLPLVDNLGVKVPVKQIVAAISEKASPRFVLIDGAQALGHLPKIDVHDLCDIFIAGGHKWLRSGHPLGIAIYGRARSRDYLSRCFNAGDRANQIDDSLCRFVSALSERFVRNQYAETVNVSPLLSFRAALEDFPCSSQERRQQWQHQAENHTHVHRVACSCGWKLQTVSEDFQCGILTIRPGKFRLKSERGGSFRRRLAKQSVAASCYGDGTIRLSMPKRILGNQELHAIEIALSQCE